MKRILLAILLLLIVAGCGERSPSGDVSAPDLKIGRMNGLRMSPSLRYLVQLAKMLPLWREAACIGQLPHTLWEYKGGLGWEAFSVIELPLINDKDTFGIILRPYGHLHPPDLKVRRRDVS